MSEWQWIKDLDNHRSGSEFLHDNEAGAAIGMITGMIGAPVALIAVAGAGLASAPVLAAKAAVVGKVAVVKAAAATTYVAVPTSTGTWAVAAVPASSSAVAASTAVGATAAVGHKIFIEACTEGLKAVACVGATAGAYAGASIQHFCRIVADEFR